MSAKFSWLVSVSSTLILALLPLWRLGPRVRRLVQGLAPRTTVTVATFRSLSRFTSPPPIPSRQRNSEPYEERSVAYRTIFLHPVLLLLLFLSMESYAATSGAKVQSTVTPEDLSDARYTSQVSGDWSGSDRFDFEDPIKLEIVVLGISVQENGVAELHFRYAHEPTIRRPPGLSKQVPISPYRVATLQAVNELKRLEVNLERFRAGSHAFVTGWPATPIQEIHSEMLVESISFIQTGELLTLHRDHPCITKFENRDKPKPRVSDLEGASRGVECPTPFGKEQIEANSNSRQ